MVNTTQACCASLNEKLTKLNVEAKSECTIYRVHEHLRNVNPNAYEPQVIAIGPYHHNKDHLKMMEDHKLRYFQHLIRRKPSNNVQSYAACVGRLEAEARKCYADAPTSLSPSEFIQMLVLDGCFIVELLLKCYLREENDPIFQMDWMIISVQRDLMLFENQLPFFVLCELFDMIVAPGQHSRLPYLLGQFFRGLYPWKGYKGQASVAPRPVKHLLHFIHCNLPPRGTEKKDKDKGSQFMKSATRLEEADVHRSWLPPGTSTEKKDKDKGLQFMESATRLEEANVHLLPPGTGTAELLMACPRLEEELQFMESPTRLEEANVHLLPPGTGTAELLMACPRLEEELQFMESPTRLEEANVHLLPPGTGTAELLMACPRLEEELQFMESPTRLEEANVHLLPPGTGTAELLMACPRLEEELQFMESPTRLEEANVHLLPPGTGTAELLMACPRLEEELQFMESPTRLEEANVHLLPPGTGTAELLMACPRLEEGLQFMESPTRLEEANVHLLPPGTGRVMACPRLEEGLQFMESPTRLEEANVHLLPPGTGRVMACPRLEEGLQFMESPTRLEEANVHRSWLHPGTGTEEKDKDKGLQFKKSATRLEEANVRFKISKPEAALFDVKFENGVMTMAPLRVDDRTESFLRNLIAYEHYFGHDEGNFVTDYVSFLDDLVDSSKDVEILSRNEIVENWLGDVEAVAKMVNKLADSIVVPNTSYAEMIENVEKHCRKRRNRWMATLRRNYLSSPWHIFSLIVGAVLLLLTITQTVCSILQMV
ncbi:uncharacterized protein LOC130995189 [Salvia miltiorrhiza]|uniref:uncharacterized protein LOC130995189 n=1 Tax=Salvia miltiorrhiza TaxID=226208 RepID=UPI0025ACA825|nr:uncharacterized protein LOC130995189 [Salvia miltiorrhiza]